jgi:hypothetical protein
VKNVWVDLETDSAPREQLLSQGNVRAVWGARLMSQRLAAVRLITCAMMEPQKNAAAIQYSRPSPQR